MLNEPPSDEDRQVAPLEEAPEQSTPQQDEKPKGNLHPLQQDDQPKRKLHPLQQQAIDARTQMQQPNGQPRQSPFTFHMPLVQPRLTYALIAVNLAIFFLAFGIMDDAQRNGLYEWGANNSRYVFEFGEYHRLITSMFLHGNLPHVVFNMMAVYYIGQTIERFYGVIRFLLIYFLGGIMGSLLSVLLNGPAISSVGASGAVFALVGAEVVFLYKHRKLFRQMAQSRLRSLVILIILNLGIGFASSSFAGGARIDNWGHIGGLIGGLVLAWYICPDLLPQRHPNRANAFLIVDTNPIEKRYQSVILFLSLILVLIIAGTLMAR